NLSVGGSLHMRDTGITELPDNLSVGGSLYLSDTGITELPDNLSVGGGLYLSDTGVTKLPDNLSVGGDLYLLGTDITKLPDSLSVGGSLIFDFEKQLTSISAYRKNCGIYCRTIYAVIIGEKIKCHAGCFSGDFSVFCDRVNDKYSGESADKYIADMQWCVDEAARKALESAD
ncbi:hypothetical protein Q4595_17380, partial [Wenyingzhuangia sp. 1_MG-2023]|nr:hypothetical protein [Wenyingzhuangia sp. 1_MG-2023]